MKMKSIVSGVFFLAVSLALGGDAYGQQGEQRVVVTVGPAQTVEERVADEVKAKELRKAAEEKLAAEESVRAAETNPKTLLGRARTIHIASDTSFFEPVQLQSALRERQELETWQMVIVDGWEKHKTADLHVSVDRPVFTYTFTYQVTHRSTGVVVASGKVTAFDGNAAAPKLARKIIEELAKARGESKPQKK